MKNLKDLFVSLRRLDLSQLKVQDSLYRISDWLSDDEHQESYPYIQNQLDFLNKLIKDAEKNNKIFTADDIRLIKESEFIQKMNLGNEFINFVNAKYNQ